MPDPQVETSIFRSDTVESRSRGGSSRIRCISDNGADFIFTVRESP